MEKIKISFNNGGDDWKDSKMTNLELLEKCANVFAYSTPTKNQGLNQESIKEANEIVHNKTLAIESESVGSPTSVEVGSGTRLPDWLENDDSNAPPKASVEKYVNSTSIGEVNQGKSINSLGRTTGPAAVEKRYRAWIRGLCGWISKPALVQSMKEATINLDALDRLWLLEVCVQETKVVKLKPDTFNFICGTLEQGLNQPGLNAFVKENSSHYGHATNLSEAIAYLRAQL